MSPWLLIEGGRVIDGLGNLAQESTNVLVRDNRIHAVGPLATAEAVPRGEQLSIIDARGASVMPGLIDVHCHMTYGESRTEEEIDLYTSHEMRVLLASRNVTKVLRAGVTSISQPGGSYYIGVGIRDGIQRGLLQGPRMSTAGRYLTTSNGLADWYPDSVGVPAGNVGRLTNSKHEMRDEVRRQIKNGVDLIKLADSPYGDYQAFTGDEMKAVADITHQLRRKCTIHARGSAEVAAAARAGFDWIMHGNIMTDETIEVLVETGTPLVPTLLLLSNMADFWREAAVPVHQADGVRRMLDKTAETLHRAREAGVKFAIGTDSGFAVTTYGEWHWRELQLMQDYAGLSNLEAIKAATSMGAPMMGHEGELGGVVQGWLADLVIVTGDPSKNLRVLQDPANMRHVVLDGVVQEFPDDLRSQVFQHDRSPNEYAYNRLVWEMIDSGHQPEPEVEVPWSAEERADLVSEVSRIERDSREESAHTLDDELRKS